jgi:hypothetical protein
MGNEWYDRTLGRSVYCVEDSTVRTIGGTAKALPMSPANLWTTTITDECRLATNFRSKVIGIAIKDRGGILPAGHSANAAYWYEPASGSWVSSTYYMHALPGWVTAFNNRRMQDSLYRLNWNTLYPIQTYTQSDSDDVAYEGKAAYESRPAFPHKLADLAEKKNYLAIASTPYGNTFTLEFAKTALVAEGLGTDEFTDFLALSLSSPDYVGHQYGPNSIEIEDTYLRLDRDLAAFFNFLDTRVGKGQYLFFITADHGVAHNPAYLKKNRIPAKTLSYAPLSVEESGRKKFGLPRVVESIDNYQLYLDYKAIDSAGIQRSDIKEWMIRQLNKHPDVLIAFDAADAGNANLPEKARNMFLNGYNTKRGGDIQVVLKPGYFLGFATGTTHGTWYPYDSHIPLVWMGWGIRRGKLYREVHMTDIAPTLAALLQIQMPNGSVGEVIEEVFKPAN